jgi:hypothetical protein
MTEVPVRVVRTASISICYHQSTLHLYILSQEELAYSLLSLKKDAIMEVEVRPMKYANAVIIVDVVRPFRLNQDSLYFGPRT